MRIAIIFLVALCVIAGVATVQARALGPGQISEPATGAPNAGSGDCDGDGDVDAIDALFTLYIVAGTFDGLLPCLEAGDVDRNGQLNAIDTALILQFTAALIDQLPVGGPKDTATPTDSLVPLTSTNTPPAPTATNTPVPPTATATETNTPETGTIKVRKEIVDGEAVVQESAPGWEILVYFDTGCSGAPFVHATTSTSPLMIGLSPGDYSVEEVEQAGYAAVSDTCIDVENLDAGDEVEVVFQNEAL